jgi:hypothetical protein
MNPTFHRILGKVVQLGFVVRDFEGHGEGIREQACDRTVADLRAHVPCSAGTTIAGGIRRIFNAPGRPFYADRKTVTT